MCDSCPIRRETEDQIAEDNTSDEFAGFIRSAMQSFGIDPDAWLEGSKTDSILSRQRGLTELCSPALNFREP